MLIQLVHAQCWGDKIFYFIFLIGLCNNYNSLLLLLVYLFSWMSKIHTLHKMKPKINSIEVHPQLSNNGHPVDGALVGAGSLWPQIRCSSSTNE
jgi:hypothetical protein